MRAFAVYLVATVPVAWTQHTDPIPVVGLQVGFSNGGARPARLNINDLFARGEEMWYVVSASQVLEGRLGC
jgi:hypothetical protein